MTDEQHNHCARLVADFAVAFTDKYKAGQAEHGGNLWQKDPVKMARAAKEEVLDQWAYIDILEKNIIEMRSRIERALNEFDSGRSTHDMALNMAGILRGEGGQR